MVYMAMAGGVAVKCHPGDSSGYKAPENKVTGFGITFFDFFRRVSWSLNIGRFQS